MSEGDPGIKKIDSWRLLQISYLHYLVDGAIKMLCFLHFEFCTTFLTRRSSFSMFKIKYEIYSLLLNAIDVLLLTIWCKCWVKSYFLKDLEYVLFVWHLAHWEFTNSKATMETPEQCVKFLERKQSSTLKKKYGQI